MQADGDHFGRVAGQVDDQAQGLADAGGQGRALDAHLREGPPPEDHHRVEDDVGHTTRHHAHHGDHHPAGGLEDLFHRHGRGDHHREQERDAGIAHSHIHDHLVRGEHPQEGGHHRDAHHRQDDPVQNVPQNALGRGGVGLFGVLGPQVIGDHRVGADGKADGHGVDQILHRVDQGQGGHGVLADLGHIVAVHDVVQRRHHHGQHHRQRHGQHQRQDGPRFHKALLHRA